MRGLVSRQLADVVATIEKQRPDLASDDANIKDLANRDFVVTSVESLENSAFNVSQDIC
jgi:hypothetical protein